MYSVLIVDDELGFAEMAAELLMMLGYTVTTANNGTVALASLAESVPDVILLDVMMPEMSGPELLQALKANEATRNIPVIMMSAAGRAVLPDELVPTIEAFLQKPFSFDELRTSLRAALPPQP